MISKKAPGKPAPPGRFLRPEVIGPTDCPLMHRWTLASTRRFKLLVHHFLPNADDRAVHDHPRPFWTLVLKGGYDDMAPCDLCEGRGFTIRVYPSGGSADPCQGCRFTGVVLHERMRAGMLRYRPATHRHRTIVLPTGAWTIVLMGAVSDWIVGDDGTLEPKWGFWTGGRWMFWRDHEERYGFGMRCSDEDSP